LGHKPGFSPLFSTLFGAFTFLPLKQQAFIFPNFPNKNSLSTQGNWFPTQGGSGSKVQSGKGQPGFSQSFPTTHSPFFGTPQLWGHPGKFPQITSNFWGHLFLGGWFLEKPFFF